MAGLISQDEELGFYFRARGREVASFEQGRKVILIEYFGIAWASL